MKAGDLFTRITIVVAAVWILLGVVTIKLLNRGDDPTARGAFGKNEAGKEPGAKSQGKTGANTKKGAGGGAKESSEKKTPSSNKPASKKPASGKPASGKSE